MRERVGKKQLRLTTRSLRSLAGKSLHFENILARKWELEKTLLRTIILLFMCLDELTKFGELLQCTDNSGHTATWILLRLRSKIKSKNQEFRSVSAGG